MEMSGEPMDLLRRTMAGYARHANFAGVLVVGLGCERNQIAGFMSEQGFAPGPRFHTFVMQETGGTRKTIEAGVAAVKETAARGEPREARDGLRRSHIKVGLQCGGSDGFSSITANPALGRGDGHPGAPRRHRDPVRDAGDLRRRAHAHARARVTREVGEKLIERIRWWKDEYSAGRDVQINGVVSPGNQAGGLANILEKSLGSSMKGGTGPLMEVYRYAEPVTQPRASCSWTRRASTRCSATGQIAGGANLIVLHHRPRLDVRRQAGRPRSSSPPTRRCTAS